jgi:trehalose-6-phosphate synthase
LGGLTYCDLVGFQTKNDRDNFADYLVRQGATQTRDGYETDGRRVRLGAFPVSIETKAYMRLARNAGRSAMVALVRESLGGSASNARMRMSAIGRLVAAILPLDNIGAMYRRPEHSGT